MARLKPTECYNIYTNGWPSSIYLPPSFINTFPFSSLEAEQQRWAPIYLSIYLSLFLS
jgi:hypothetical protein